jgi:hypothetical protein
MLKKATPLLLSGQFFNLYFFAAPVFPISGIGKISSKVEYILNCEDCHKA